MPRETATLARTSLGGLGVFLLLLVVLHLVRSDYDSRSRWLSEYAIGPYGWLMNAAFLTLAAAEGALALGMLRGGPSSVWVRAGAAFLGFAAIALALLTVFPTDLDVPGQGASRLRTRAGLWHDHLNAVGGYAVLAAMGCWVFAFRRAATWRKLVGPTAITIGLALANGALAPVVMPRAWAGLSQRFSLLLAVVWLGIVGYHLRRNTQQ